MAVLASYGVAGPGVASAGSITGSSFEVDSDANLVVDGGGGAVDWLSGGHGSSMRSGVLVRDDRPTGQDDDSFTQGTSEDDAHTTITTGSIPNNKSDLTHFGVYVERYSSSTFVNVFWTRVQEPNGTTNMDFEFNQSAVRDNDVSNNSGLSTHTIPVRTTGDILITYDLTKGGTHPVLSRRTWTGSDWGPATTFSDTQALGSINSTAISATDSDGLSGLSARTFGEASINLAALVPASDRCTTYGSVYVKSRASDSFTAELKDFIAPEPVTISNCGAVSVHKTDAHGALAGAGFTLYKDVAPTGGVSAGAEDKVAANVIGTCTTDAGGDCTISDVPKGGFWLVETTVPAGHDPAADQHVTISAGDQVVALTLNDPIQHGTITVTKNAVPDDPQDFTFSLDGSSFTLDDDPSDATQPSTRSFTVEVGTHSLSETSVPTGWVNTGLVCSDPTSDTTVSAPDATVKVAKNETVACTYTDTFTKLNPDLQTQSAEASANTSWNDTASLTGDGIHPITGTVAFFACAAGASATPCTSGGTQVGTAAPVTHVSGASYTAATTSPYTPTDAGWTCFRAEFTSTSPYYADSSHTNATTECFLKHNANLTVSKTATPAFGRTYHWTISKQVDQTRATIAEGGTATFDYTVSVANTHSDDAWNVTGTITVTNPNAVPFEHVNVSDHIDNGAGDCAVTGGTDATIPANGSATFDYLCTYTTTPTQPTGTNSATATWDSGAYFTTASSASGTASVDFSAQEPTTTDESITVTDSVQGVLGTVNAATDTNPKVFTYSVTRAGEAGTCTSYDNTATFTTNDSESTGSSSQSVDVCVGSALLTTATGTGSFDRSYSWAIGKTGTPTLISNANGSTGTFSYTVTVTPTGTTDGGFALGGEVSVANPNDWEDVVADVTVTSDLGGGVTCTVTGGSQVTIPKSGSVTLPYSCSFTGTPATSGTATATATWDASAASTPSGSSSADVPVTLTLDQEVNRVITVVDDKTDPANPVTLGTWDYLDGPHDFTYTLTQAGADDVCTDYTNVATIVQTEQSATATVTLCHTFTGGGGTPSPGPTPSPTPPPTQGGGLPFTGDSLSLLARTAIALVAAGLMMLVVSRRRRSPSR